MSSNISENALVLFGLWFGSGFVIGFAGWANQCLATGVCPIW